MKKFEMYVTGRMVKADPYENLDTYVRARDAEKLKRLNKEMLEVLKKTLKYLTTPQNCKDELELQQLIQERADVIAALTTTTAKAEEE
jgi:hypothetical protein